jgi:hypothetical protein
MPPWPAQFVPISAAVRHDISAKPARPATNTLQERKKMESRRATPEQRRERSELDPRFGKIGISAVAAAMRYGSDARNPAYAPAKLSDQPTDEAAA